MRMAEPRLPRCVHAHEWGRRAVHVPKHCVAASLPAMQQTEPLKLEVLVQTVPMTAVDTARRCGCMCELGGNPMEPSGKKV